MVFESVLVVLCSLILTLDSMPASLSKSSSASDGSSLAVGKPCKWCKLSRRSPNPLKHMLSLVCLPWAREDGEECRPCANYIRIICRRGMTKLELGLKLTDKEAGPENQVIYNKGREQYIVAYNA